MFGSKVRVMCDSYIAVTEMYCQSSHCMCQTLTTMVRQVAYKGNASLVGELDNGHCGAL